jgi:hypothetical protein
VYLPDCLIRQYEEKAGDDVAYRRGGMPFARHQGHFARITVEYFPWLRGLAPKIDFQQGNE